MKCEARPRSPRARPLVRFDPLKVRIPILTLLNRATLATATAWTITIASVHRIVQSIPLILTSVRKENIDLIPNSATDNTRLTQSTHLQNLNSDRPCCAPPSSLIP